MFLLDPTTCKLNIKKLVIAHTIEETSVQRPVKVNKVSSFLFLICNALYIKKFIIELILQSLTEIILLYLILFFISFYILKSKEIKKQE